MVMRVFVTNRGQITCWSRPRRPAGEVVAVMMTKGRGFSNVKAKWELGWAVHHPSWCQGVEEGLM